MERLPFHLIWLIILNDFEFRAGVTGVPVTAATFSAAAVIDLAAAGAPFVMGHFAFFPVRITAGNEGIAAFEAFLAGFQIMLRAEHALFGNGFQTGLDAAVDGGEGGRGSRCAVKAAVLRDIGEILLIEGAELGIHAGAGDHRIHFGALIQGHAGQLDTGGGGGGGEDLGAAGIEGAGVIQEGQGQHTLSDPEVGRIGSGIGPVVGAQE